MDKISRIRRVLSSRMIFWDMVWKQLKGKYSGSMLGIWWAVITPFILAVSISLVFNHVLKVSFKGYTLFVLAGIMPWLCFSNSISEGSNSFIAGSSLLKQNIFPREFIPFTSIAASFLTFIIGLFFILPVFILYNIKIIIILPFLFVVLPLYFLFIAGLGIILATINVFYRDVTHFLSIGLMVWFWITPVFYSLDMIDFPYRWIALINPLTYYVTIYQDIIFKGVIPDIYTALTALLISTGSFVMGYYFFLRNEPRLLKRL